MEKEESLAQDDVHVKESFQESVDQDRSKIQSSDSNEVVPTVDDLIKRVEEFVEHDVRDIEALVLTTEDLEAFPEPQITSSDPYERRVARRLRIRNKLIEKRKKEEASLTEKREGEEDEEQFDPDNVVENQTENSTVRLLQLIQDGRELISNVKVAAVSYEVKRRDRVRLERAERREKLEAAAEEAGARFMEISNRWAAVKREKDPLDIHSATQDQREKCMEVIAKKDAIIEDLKKELEEADTNFVKNLERQEEEINILVDRINQQINIMRTAAHTELELLEAAIAVEREETIKHNVAEWEDLVDKKETIESETNLMRNHIMDSHEKSIDAMESEQREQLKIKRTQQTRVIHDMELQVQELEALCLFNSEKLNHNYRVLKKRADENQIIKSQQKRTITKLQDVVSSLRKKIGKKEMSLSNETKRMCEELSSLNRNIKDMERRADQAAALSDSKFLALWNFNESQAQQLVQKIAYADKIMYDEFLDIPAPALVLPTLKKEHLPSYKDLKSKEKGCETEEKKGLEEEMDTALDEERALKSILFAVSRYASFLIEENVKDVVNNFSPDEQIIVRLDKILTTVGVKRDTEIKALVKHFLPHLVCRTCQEKAISEYSFTQQVGSEDFTNAQSEDSQDQIINVVVDNLERKTREEEALRGDDVMEAMSSSVRERITVIDTVVAQELGGNDQEPSTPPQPATAPDQLLQPGSKRETVEFMPDSMLFLKMPRGTTLTGTQVETFSLDQRQHSTAGHKNSMGLCLKEKHEISIDRLVLVKALCAYSKEINNRTQEKDVKSLSNIISEKWMTVSRSLSNEDIKTFWGNFDIVDKEKEQLWDTFTEGLKEYHKELTERSRLNEEVMKMKRSNQDLVRLLQKYLSISTEESSEMDFPRIKQYFADTEELTCTDTK